MEDTFHYFVSGICNSAEYVRLVNAVSLQFPEVSHLVYKGKLGTLDMVLYKALELDTIRDAGFKIKLI